LIATLNVDKCNRRQTRKAKELATCYVHNIYAKRILFLLQGPYQLHQEVVTQMATERFVAPELDPNAANAAQAEGGEGKGN
jgi:hypothetical protein